MAAPNSLRVLVVDDDERFAMAVTALLESGGLTVVGRAENGAVALSLVETLEPDAVTMDIDMPVMDGVQATRTLAAQHPLLPVVLLTGSESSDRVQEALSAGAVAFVPKGDASAELVQAIGEAVAQSNAA